MNNNDRYYRCPECNRVFDREDMMWSYDCHGILYRLLCPECYERIMDDVGYDGEYYDERDECLDYDY